VVLTDPQAYAWGGETIVLDGVPVGELASCGFSPLASACVGLGYVRGAAANRAHAGTAAQLQLWGEPVPVALHDHWPPRAGPGV
jgi:4-methylaminobutanoate oxidase (formaldehyde-forming)